MHHRYVILILLAFAAGAEADGRSKAKGSAERAIPYKIELDAAAVATAAQADIAEGARGSAVLRAQILLNRAHFSCGQIDGSFGGNLRKTVAAFQADRKLPVTGAVDAATWAALNQDQAPLLVPYTISLEDLKGPFVQISSGMTQQAKLPYPGYASPLDQFGERFHASQEALKLLNPGADFGREGQALTVPNVQTMPPGAAARVVVSKDESSVRAYGADGKLLSYYSATIGSQHDPLPVGDWKILGVGHNPKFHYNAKLFWDARNPHEKAVIQAGPRNPVGMVWIDLSKEHYGIHGTPDPALVGHAFSHGCIRLTNWDALELASMVKPGVLAELTAGSESTAAAHAPAR